MASISSPSRRSSLISSYTSLEECQKMKAILVRQAFTESEIEDLHQVASLGASSSSSPIVLKKHGHLHSKLYLHAYNLIQQQKPCLFKKLFEVMKEVDQQEWNFIEGALLQLQQTTTEEGQVGSGDENTSAPPQRGDDVEEVVDDGGGEEDAKVEAEAEAEAEAHAEDGVFGGCCDDVHTSLDADSDPCYDDDDSSGGADGEYGVNIRVVEYHTYVRHASLPQRDHFDGGSLMTMVIMLSTPGVDFTGGVLQTWDGGDQFTQYHLQRGDCVVFPSHKYHSVTEVTSGCRQIVAVEVWMGEEGCEDLRPGAFGHLIPDW